MALQRARLAEIQYIASSAAAIYTNPATTVTFIRGVILHNTNVTAELVALHMVPDSSGAVGTAAAANRFANISLAANETLFFEFPLYLQLVDTNETLQASTTTASKVTVIVCGDKE